MPFLYFYLCLMCASLNPALRAWRTYTVLFPYIIYSPLLAEEKQMLPHIPRVDDTIWVFVYYIQFDKCAFRSPFFQELCPHIRLRVNRSVGGGGGCLESRTFSNKHSALIIKKNASWGSLLRLHKDRVGEP